jgi:hypothetical protein
MQTKSDVMQGDGELGQDDVTRGKLSALAFHPTKAEELTSLYKHCFDLHK